MRQNGISPGPVSPLQTSMNNTNTFISNLTAPEIPDDVNDHNALIEDDNESESTMSERSDISQGDLERIRRK